MLLVLLHPFLSDDRSQTGHFQLCATDKQPMNKNKTTHNLYISVKHGAKMMCRCR